MKPVVIKNPIINSPFEEPKRHFRFTDDGITDEIVTGRRTSQYFIPIPHSKKKSPKQLSFDSEWTADRIEENSFINQIREKVATWRKGGYVGITRSTARLLEYWQRPDREHKLFFCQIEALETAIYITEVANKYGDAWIENRLRDANNDANPSIFRVAFKMATGSGKTVVMAMLISWHVLNKLANSQDARFSDTFLIVTPGITIRDRLRVLLPNDPQNYYRQHDIVPPDQMDDLGKAKFVITNFHSFKLRERIAAGKLTKDILKQDNGDSPFTETPDQMVKRVCRELGNKKNIIVINDEAHHCYRRKPDEDVTKLSPEDRKEAEKRNEEARVWISGLEAVKAKIGVKVIYDLSATPFFLRGSGYSKMTADGKKITEGILFPWVVSDFSLIDAIEAGIVKVPRVPVSDNAMVGDLPTPTYRELWLHIRDELPKKGRGAGKTSIEPALPASLEGALHSLYTNYVQYYQKWEQDTKARSQMPPVFIVVCNNTAVSKMVYDYIGGWEKQLPNEAKVLVPGKLPLFNNVNGDRWTARPNTILVDSEQLESGEAMSTDFKKIAAMEIEEFKGEYRTRFPGRDVEKLTDEDLLREVMNTVGKEGKLGEQVKCVVSVSMLTEGWDTTTVTHVLGVRAFGTQLLCEQVVGRALRRMSYALSPISLEVDGSTIEIESFEPEYAEVYGVPFSFIPSSGSIVTPKKQRPITHIRALEDRISCELTYPRVIGYRYELPSEKLEASFTYSSKLAITPKDVPTETEVSSILGEAGKHSLDDLKARREQEIDFLLASLVLEKYFRDTEGNSKPWLFPQVLKIARRWRLECLICKDNTFPQLVLLTGKAHDATDRIYRAIVTSTPGEKRLLPILRPYETVGSTRYVDFDTAKDTYKTNRSKCHISHVVLDSSWEAKLAQVLEDESKVFCYVKNQGLGFTIPYTYKGEEHAYIPDYIVRIEDGHGRDDQLNLIIEVSGEPKPEKAAKVATARNLWVPAVNNYGKCGRWAFIEITDPWEAEIIVQAACKGEYYDEKTLFQTPED